eukprot:gnl/TRDRNA2_/TRDRNA2_80561_c0_seq1.p1 gnl/TRDRNA2_/TRDRNA2_80561_c0~~gnl/TRDRNA2_/TRDRNA2_80561_c0_seq1.p1  ORF type:complete len:177 (+),score=40.55 gnl/TRDRNA2_/TRDRNA2_80561_c0_seq1:40-570(+)
MSAEQGSAAGKCGLGLLYLKGLGVAQDQEKAMELLNQAVEDGDAGAAYKLGHMYASGVWGVKTDSKKAITLYAKALGLDSTSPGLSKDVEKAMMYLKEAAASGNADAANCLATLAVPAESDSSKEVPTDLSMCAHCGAKGAQKRCGRCKAVGYCSEACQRSHWTAGHKAVCGKQTA